MTSDVLTLQIVELGREEFRIGEATYNQVREKDGVWEFVLRVQTAGQLLRVPELEEVIHTEVFLEASVALGAAAIALRPGMILHIQPGGSDPVRGVNLAIFHYFNWESIESMSVEICEVLPEAIVARLSDRTIVNGHNGTDPDTQFTLQTKFSLDPKLQRSFY